MKTNSLATALLVFAAAPLAPADGPKLVRETVLMKVQTEFYGIPGIVRLSPDGEHLLLMRPLASKPAAAPRPRERDPRRGRARHMALRQWKTRVERAVPIPPFTGAGSALVMGIPNPFSADGRLLVVPAGVDADGSGFFSPGREQVQPGVYDIERGTLRRIDVRGTWMIALFDAAGKHLLFTVLDRRSPPAGRMYVAPVETLKPKLLAPWGLPRAPRPGGTMVVLGRFAVPPGGGRPVSKLLLYDFAKGAEVADIPVQDPAGLLDVVAPQWTADGRYLYYIDAEAARAGDGGPVRRKTFTRVWDARQRKEVARLSGCLPIGPCGGRTTMVLSKWGRATPALLHDAATGKQQPLKGPTPIHPISTNGTYLVYDRGDDQGNHFLYRAEIRTAAEP